MKPWNKESILTLLENNDKMVMRSVIQLYNKQTQDEQQVELTKYHNNMGFRANHAKRMTGMAKFALKTGFLTKKQIAWLRPKIRIYATQLANIANELNEKTAKSSQLTIG